jgi:hypothetical protein
MSRGRFNIDNATLPFTSPSFGLLSPATTQLEIPNPKWRMGLQWQSFCPAVAGTYGECTVPDEEIPPAPPKGVTWDWVTRGSTPVTIYSRVDCAPVGQWEDLSTRNQQALIRSEQRELERIFWTGGIVAGAGVTDAYPHLAANAEVTDGDDLLQMPAEPVSEDPQSIEVALGMLEAAMRRCYPGVATIHMPIRLAALAADHRLIESRNGVMYTTSVGSKVVIGEYPGTGPDGTLPPTGQTWMYASGEVFWVREATPHSFRAVESFDRDVNTLSMIAERTYAYGWDCCLFAALVLNGEVEIP